MYPPSCCADTSAVDVDLAKIIDRAELQQHVLGLTAQRRFEPGPIPRRPHVVAQIVELRVPGEPNANRAPRLRALEVLEIAIWRSGSGRNSQPLSSSRRCCVSEARKGRPGIISRAVNQRRTLNPVYKRLACMRATEAEKRRAKRLPSPSPSSVCIQVQSIQERETQKQSIGALMRLVVTGGAGYIGATTVRALLAAGHDVLVYDNLSKGHRSAVAARGAFHARRHLRPPGRLRLACRSSGRKRCCISPPYRGRRINGCAGEILPQQFGGNAHAA